jgi:uncharacterized repeat protein (TIGR04076 family)
MQRTQVRITLVSQHGTCPRGHAVGDSWTTDGASPGGLCLGALNSLTPAITTLRFGGGFPWMSDPNTGVFACPDHAVRNVFKLERMAPPEGASIERAKLAGEV